MQSSSDVADMRTALASPEMRRVLARFVRASGFLKVSYVSGDTHGTAFNEGRRSIGFELKLAIDAADPDAFARLQAEYERRKDT